MFNFSENNTFETILARCLARVDSSLDKRQGSIIYDALAPACAELAQCYIALDVYGEQTYLLTAVSNNLDNRVVDYGLSRIPATYSERELTTYDIDDTLMDVAIGSRFSVPNESGGYSYTVISKTSTGKFVVRCETLGDGGNDYFGDLLPLVSINNLGKAILGTVIKPGENEETDDSLRQRALAKLNQETFAGNKVAYKQFVKDIDGVEKTKIFPIWDGGGTVKVAIIASNNTIPSTAFVNSVQTLIDPIANQGQGLGIAPIGHTVTVAAPTQLNINISAELTLDGDYTIEQIKDAVEEQLALYISRVQEKWEDKDTLIIYTSKVIAAILEVPQVENVSNLTINGESTDLAISITSSSIPFPMLNEVTLSESE